LALSVRGIEPLYVEIGRSLLEGSLSRELAGGNYIRGKAPGIPM